ncbi:unnamed protein product [Rhizophagus irregularis]|nr:unnamed protein product [Rhizophagus irregularis]
MPGETEIQDSEDAKKWIDWIEEAIVKEYFRYYEYKNFILKSFIDLSEATIKEVVHELKLHRDVQHHPNIISFCGITKSESVGAVSFLHNEGIVHRDLHSGNGEQYDVALALNIIQGQREHIVPGTPEAYVKIYTDCWNDEPEERPTANKVLEKLKA